MHFLGAILFWWNDHVYMSHAKYRYDHGHGIGAEIGMAAVIPTFGQAML